MYCHKDPVQWLRGLAGARIHRADSLEMVGFARPFIGELSGRLERRMAFGLARSDGDLYVSFDDMTLTSALTRLSPL